MAQIDVSKVPAIVTITNTSERVKVVQLYKTNTSIKLQPSDELNLLVDNSNELIYFLSLSSVELSVTHEAVEEEEVEDVE